MSINLLIFLKLLSQHYAIHAGPLCSENIRLRGVRRYIPGCSYQALLLIAAPGDFLDMDVQLKDPGLSHNVVITRDPWLFSILEKKAPAILAADGPAPTEAFENSLWDLWEQLSGWLDLLNNISLTQKSFQQLIDACDEMVAEPVALINQHFCYVAYSQKLSAQRGYVEKFVNESNTVSMDITTQLIVNPEYGDLAQKQGVFEFMDDYHFIACNIFSENTCVGRLISICTEKPDIDAYQKQIIALLAPYVEKMYRQNGTFFLEEPAMPRLHQLLLQSLQSDGVTAADWIPLIGGLGWKADHSYQLMSIRPTFRYEKNLYPDYICPQIEQQWPFSIAVVLDGSLMVLINQSRARQDYTQELSYFLRDNLMCAGVSRSFMDLSRIRAACRQSAQALALGQRKNPHFWYHSFDDYAFDHILEHAHSDYEPTQICHPGLLLLLGHDKASGSQYYETLRAWFQHRFNSVAAAKALYIHRTTFIKRMEHIKELTQIDFEDWDTIVYLTLSFKLLSEAE